MKNFFPLITALLVTVGLIVGYSVMYAHVSDDVARAARALEQSDVLSEQDALIRSQQLFLENARGDIEQLNTYIASDTEVITIIETVEQTAAREGVQLAISTVSTVSYDGWQSHEGVRVDFSSSGTFQEMMRFIAALEALSTAAKVESASLEVAGGSEWFGAFSIMFVKEK